MLTALRRRAETRALARRLCVALTEQARAPQFFLDLKVPDTMDGRFDLVALHAWLVLERLRSTKAEAQALIDEIFLAFDEALRDLGTGDAGMHRRLKTMAGVFYGRLQAYRGAQGAEELGEAIWRNLYRGAGNRHAEARAMATYAWNAHSHLASSNLTQDRLEFGPLPSM